ncbi:acyltransferase [Shewanella japonica]|uniref:acyltransferase n=1 Tax=Shewanella japonica TaxID=93973 RepID=UPI0024952956|nr:hypothetical protein [Shewanella japonica]
MKIEGLNIEDNGNNNIIKIDDGSLFRGCKIVLNGNDHFIELGKALLYKGLVLNLKGNNKRICIGESNKNIKGVKIVSIRGDNQVVTIGRNFSCGGLEIQMNDGDECCTIGDNGLFSWGIKIRTSDGHSVVDLDSNIAINLPKDVKIGNRVWVGEDVRFLKGASVPDDCVIGSNAILTKSFTKPNCVIAGFPATVVKSNIRWDRKMPSEYNKKNS